MNTGLHPVPRGLAMGTSVTALDDAQLVERFARHGDNAAFEAFVRHYLPALRRFIAARLPPDVDAAEVEQDVLVRLHAGLGRFRFGADPTTYLYRICWNAAADALRARKRERGRARRMAALKADGDPRNGDDPAIQLERSSEGARVLAALRSLGEPDASLVYLRDSEGVGVAELARTFGLPEGTVKSRLSRARGRLRAALEPDTTGGRHDP